MTSKEAAWFDPNTGRITVDWDYLRKIPAWRRQAVAVICHELCHAWQWYVTVKQNGRLWNKLCFRDRIEKWPYKVQDWVLRILLVPINHDDETNPVQEAIDRLYTNKPS